MQKLKRNSALQGSYRLYGFCFILGKRIFPFHTLLYRIHVCLSGPGMLASFCSKILIGTNSYLKLDQHHITFQTYISALHH